MSKLIIYDFDGTLTPYPITNYVFLESCGYLNGGNNKEFQQIVFSRMKEKKINIYEAFYETIFDVLISNGYKLVDDVFIIGAEYLEYNKGVRQFFEYLSTTNVDNYLISSGMEPLLNKVLVAKYFKEIYGTRFKYDKNNEVIGIDVLITDELKVDILKTIMKNNNLIDCSDIIYIGDGLTDLYAMEFVVKNGGYSFFVYDNYDELNEIMKKNIVTYFFHKDFSLNSELCVKIKEIFKL